MQQSSKNSEQISGLSNSFISSLSEFKEKMESTATLNRDSWVRSETLRKDEEDRYISLFS